MRLTNDPATESSLVYAPDGESIYFTRSDGADTSIWRIGALGGQPRKVLNQARAPAVSPDGRRIAWFTPEPDGFFSLVVSALDGSACRVLAENVQGVVHVSSPRGHRTVGGSRTRLAACSQHVTCSLLKLLTEACGRSRASRGARKGPAPQPGFPTIVTSSFCTYRQHVLKARPILECWTRRLDRSRGSRPTLPRGSTARVSRPMGTAWLSPPTARNARCGKCPSDLMRWKAGAPHFAW